MKRVLYCTVAFMVLLDARVSTAATLEKELSDLREDVKILQRQMYRENNRTNSASGEVQGKISEYDEVIRKLNGRMDELEHQLSENNAKIEKYNRDMEIRLKILEGRPIPSELSAPVASIPATYDAPVARNAASSVAGDKISGSDLAPLDGEPVQLQARPVALTSDTNIVNANDPQTMYDNALKAYNTGYYDEAELAFADILSQFPRHALASNAQYWLGEVYLKRQDYNKAKVAFKNGYENFKNGNKGADSLYRLATTFSLMGDNKRACLILASFDDEYPHAHPEVKHKVNAEKQKLNCKRN